MAKSSFWPSDEAWKAVSPHLPRGRPGKPSVDISGILHVLKTDCRWRDVPSIYGPLTTIYNRYNRWSQRRERQLMERLEFNLLFRWFVGLGVDDATWDHSTFSKNRARLLEGDIAGELLRAVLAQPGVKRLLSTDHFSVDGTLIEAWASMKSFKPKDGSGEPPASGGGRNREADFHGEKRTNGTHVSTTDPQARLYRKGEVRPVMRLQYGLYNASVNVNAVGCHRVAGNSSNIA